VRGDEGWSASGFIKRYSSFIRRNQATFELVGSPIFSLSLAPMISSSNIVP
jgi:hypothetical protein